MIATEITKTPEGLVEKTHTNLKNLIDRYVPRYTQEEVWEMERQHGDVVFDFLRTIHEYRERNEQMAKHMDGMEKEYYQKVALPVSLGNFTADSMIDPHSPGTVYRVRWQIDPLYMSYRMPDDRYQRVNERDTPHLFEMLSRRFEEKAKDTLIPALRKAFMELYVNETR